MSLPSLIPRPVCRTDSSSASLNVFDANSGWDYALGGLPFLSAASKDFPIERKTADYYKPLSDTFGEPGEHTLQQWWVKAQSSFHGGAFQQYIDTPSVDTQQVRPLRYQSSYGVNPWTAGSVSLLKQTQKAITAGSGAQCRVVWDGSHYQIYVSDAATLKVYQETVSGLTLSYAPTTITWGGSGTITGITTDGTNIYVMDSSGIYRIPGGSTTGTQLYSAPSGSANGVLGWAKERLVVGLNCTAGSFVYGVLANPTAGLPITMTTVVGTANGAPLMTHPNPAFKWACFTDGPDAFYAGGNAGQQGAIFKFVLDTSGAAPVVSSGISAASFPPGETVSSLTAYVATLIGIVTSKGVRVGQFTQSGDFTYGPLSFTNKSAAALGGCTGAGRWFFAGVTMDDGTAGLVRVDTAQQMAMKQFSYVPDQQFASAYDLRAADTSEVPVAGSVTSVDSLGPDRRVFMVNGVGVYVEHPTKYVPSGTLTTSRLRFETLDPKVFRYVRVRAEPDTIGVGDSGTVAVAIATNADGPGQTVATLNVATMQDSDDLPCNVSKGVFATATFTFGRSADSLHTPVLTGYQLKSLPAQKRQHLISLPLSLFDNETDKVGNRHGGDSTALLRLLALEVLEAAGDIITLQHLNVDPTVTFNELVVVEQIDFIQTSQPTDEEGFGGIVVVRLRTV